MLNLSNTSKIKKQVIRPKKIISLHFAIFFFFIWICLSNGYSRFLSLFDQKFNPRKICALLCCHIVALSCINGGGTCRKFYDFKKYDPWWWSMFFNILPSKPIYICFVLLVSMYLISGSWINHNFTLFLTSNILSLYFFFNRMATFNNPQFFSLMHLHQHGEYIEKLRKRILKQVRWKVQISVLFSSIKYFDEPWYYFENRSSNFLIRKYASVSTDMKIIFCYQQIGFRSIWQLELLPMVY